MSDDNWLVAFDGVGLVDKTPIGQGVRKRTRSRSHVGGKQMEFPFAWRTYGLASQTCQFLIWQGLHYHGFVERSVMPPKMRVQGQFHRCLGCGVAAKRIRFAKSINMSVRL